MLYADGLAFVESKFRSTQSYKFSPDLKNQAMTVHAVYVIPGSGTDHPVLPGQSLTICDTPIDHRVSNENSFNLSDADFEWYDESTVPSQTDIDNPEVPNMDKWYCDTKSIFILHNQGFTSFALARIPVSKQEFLTDYYYTYNYTLYLPSGTFPMSGDGFKIPNQWIADGVNCSVESDRKWNVLPAAIDAGWTWCGRMSLRQRPILQKRAPENAVSDSRRAQSAERLQQFFARLQPRLHAFNNRGAAVGSKCQR